MKSKDGFQDKVSQKLLQRYSREASKILLTASPSATSAIFSSVAGLMTGKVFPETESCHSLLMKIWLFIKILGYFKMTTPATGTTDLGMLDLDSRHGLGDIWVWWCGLETEAKNLLKAKQLSEATAYLYQQNALPQASLTTNNNR